MFTAPAPSTNQKSSNSSSPILESPPPALAEDEHPSPPPPSPEGSLPKESDVSSSSVSASSSTSSSSPPSPSSSVSSGKSSISFPLSIKSDESSPSRPSSMVSPKSSSPATTSSSSTALSLPSTSDSSRNSNGSGMNMPLIVGAAAGVGAFFVMLILACICSSKKKRQKRHNPMQYYADSSTYKVSDSDFYTGAPSSNWHQEMDNAAKSPRVQPGGGGWHPLPPLMSGGEMSSGYSGPHGTALPPPSPGLALGFNKSTFTYEELAAATNGFSQSNLLGQGGFGYVHKGVLPNGKEVAVKQLKSGSGQGEREFHAEVDIISRVHHRHLVSLVGYCISGSQRVLVYEYVPNKTLEYHLHGKGLPVMNWSTRLKIALGSAKGLAYLHEDCHPRIIHRDIKCANILLDFKFEAMVADFGLAKLTNDNHTHVSTRVMGTFGYLAPEYASSGKLTEKSDVFSYGVMLLELITGRRPVDSSRAFMEDSLVDWARPVLSRALADGNFDEVADTRLDGKYNPMEMARMVASAAAAVRHSARRRPKMSQIVRALEGDVSLEDLNEGMRPGQSMLFSSGSEYETSSYTSSMNRIRKFAIANPEYSGTLSDYGHRRLPSDSDDIFSEEFVHQMQRANAPL